MRGDDAHHAGNHAEEGAGHQNAEAEPALQGHVKLPDNQDRKQHEGQVGEGEDGCRLSAKLVIFVSPES